MYRIEVTPGEESVFRTIEELAVGIRNGVITPRARIYHQASQKWLPISLHPHYKKALEMPAASSAHPTAKTTPSGQVPPRPTPRLESLAAAPSPEPKVEAEPARVIPAPVPSPILAMQQEVLRDLPVVAIPEPEPLPWTRPAPRVAAPPPAPQIVHPPATIPPPTVAAAAAPRPTPLVEQRRAQLDAIDEAAAPRPTARRSARMSGRPMLLLGVAAALVIGTHFALTATPAPSADQTEPAAPADVEEPSASDAAIEEPVQRVAEPSPPPVVTPQPPQRVTSAPARVVMTPGPAFAGSVPARPGVRPTAESKATKVPSAFAPASTEAPAPPAIAPAPASLELALPALPPESLVSSARTKDTTAMKKILRALNGSKP
jgi:hypothetical protein